MADRRKLMVDIDRTLKRVQEGRSAFQEILEKFDASNNQAQKEKYEADLKKEIKRLQRYRDQIKTWVSGNEVKDKEPLIEARKCIENDMERFKVIEKETKTKAYSKEGLLSAEAKKDPHQKQKDELDDWLKQTIAALKNKAEKYEYDLESLAATGKKKRMDKEKAAILEEKKEKFELCTFHIEKLETVMRLLDNDILNCDGVRSLIEPIEYVKEYIDETYMEDYRNLYDDLHLDELGDASILTPNPLVTPGQVDFDATPTPTFANVARSANGDEALIFSPNLHPGSSTSSNASSSRERPKTSAEEKCVIAPSSLSSTSTPMKDKKERNSKSQPSASGLNQTLPSSLHLPGTVVTPTACKKSFVGAASSKLETEKPTVHTSEVAPTLRENYAKVAGESKKDRTKKEQQQSEPENKGAASVPGPMASTPNTKNEKRRERAESSESGTLVGSASGRTTSPVTSEPAKSLQQLNTADSSAHVAPTFSLCASAQEVNAHDEQFPSVACIQPIDALSPYRNKQYDRCRPPAELRSQLSALELAYKRQPAATDLLRSRMYISRRPTSIPSYYPSEPLKGMELDSYYSNLDPQTLFFIFYYFDGTKAQYMAARALKRMSWRFHTRLMYWFQRHEEPKQITDEYESGSYLFYDFESMTQRRREDFMFHYNFLEDNDL